jgi:hypothetical protein
VVKLRFERILASRTLASLLSQMAVTGLAADSGN